MQVRPDIFYIVDGHSLIHRNYHAVFPALSGPAGSCGWCDGSGQDTGDQCEACKGTGQEPTKATYLFFKQLLKLSHRKDMAYLAICNDGPRSRLLRRKRCPSYKGHRADTLADLRVQMKRIKSILPMLGVATYQIEGYEADDVIATLARKYVSDEVHVRIWSRDKDLACLLSDDRIKMHDPLDEMDLGAEWPISRFKVRPEQMPSYLALVGDATDGIDGVAGIGEKTAVSLLAQYPDLPAILAAAASGDIGGRVGKLLRQADENGSARLAQDLVALATVPVKFKVSELEYRGLNLKAAAPVFRSLGFRRWAENL